MPRNERAKARERIRNTVQEFGLNSPGTDEHWRNKIMEELRAIEGANAVAAEVMDMFNRLLFACVAQATGSDPATPHAKLCQAVADQVQAFNTKASAPVANNG